MNKFCPSDKDVTKSYFHAVVYEEKILLDKGDLPQLKWPKFAEFTLDACMNLVMKDPYLQKHFPEPD